MTTCADCGHANSDTARFCEQCAAPLATAPTPREQRKTITVLFCDVTGSTALGESTDPEALRALLARYFERMKSILESHGGTVEKFIGDAVVAVFGVPQVHEDDALRACRAAVEMREALPELDLQARIGLNTGEVVTGTEERLATGDAVNVAARLEQAAAPGQILLGADTLALVRGAVETDPVEPLALKGKAEPVPAHHLLAVTGELERRDETRFVGRTEELETLRRASQRVFAEQRCELVTLVGEAGVGKSRLTAEFLSSIEAEVVSGRCLSYGEGITYWPVVEVLKQLDLLPEEEAAAAAIQSLTGETDEKTSAEEIAWAFRKTLEQAAAKRRLVVVFDDIQWGEETFLDLIEHVALLSSGVPILLLCIARPELQERRPAWAVTFRLEPLDERDVDHLIPKAIAADFRARIARASGGNPLFIEEMLAMVGERDVDVTVAVPPTLQALLAARLDQLEGPERSILERGAVEGEIFHRGAVQALGRDETTLVTPRLAALVRKHLVRPDRTQLLGEDGFRFRHLLIRDAAYGALPKAARAELHERFAAWLGEHGADVVELDEILGYHLEQACRYRDELGLAARDDLAAAARRRLTAAGRRAYLRADYGAAVSLLERAAALVPADAVDVALETDLAEALFDTGRGEDALQRAQSLAERASAAGDRVGELCGRIQEGWFTIFLQPEGASEQLAALLEQALPVFEDARDDLALYIGYSALEKVELTRGKMDARLDACERAFVHAQRAGLPHELLWGRGASRYYGSTPAMELLAWLDEQEAGGVRGHWLRRFRGAALAMLGHVDQGRALLAQARAELAERGGGILLALTTAQESVDVELLAGDPAAAVELGEEGCRMLEELGEKGFYSYAAGKLARALYALDRLEEDEAWARRAAELAASDDAFTQMVWRQVSAKVLARKGQHADAERLAREAVAIGEETDWLEGLGDAYGDLAEVLSFAGRRAAAAEALEQALDRYERKGNLVMTARTRERLDFLRQEASA